MKALQWYWGRLHCKSQQWRSNAKTFPLWRQGTSGFPLPGKPSCPLFPSFHSPTQHNLALRWLSEWYRRMLTCGCWQCVSQMANALSSSFFKIKGDVLKPVKIILKNWSEHNKVSRSTVTLSSSTALYWGWIHLQKKIWTAVIPNRIFIWLPTQFIWLEIITFLAHMCSSESVFICQAWQCAFWHIYFIHYLQVVQMKAKLPWIKHPIPWKHLGKTCYINNPINNQPFTTAQNTSGTGWCHVEPAQCI